MESKIGVSSYLKNTVLRLSLIVSINIKCGGTYNCRVVRRMIHVLDSNAFHTITILELMIEDNIDEVSYGCNRE